MNGIINIYIFNQPQLSRKEILGVPMKKKPMSSQNLRKLEKKSEKWPFIDRFRPKRYQR